MRFFHIVSNKNAEAILKEGFRDGTGYYLTDQEHTGVWMCDKPFNESYQDDTNTPLGIEIPEEDLAVFSAANKKRPR